MKHKQAGYKATENEATLYQTMVAQKVRTLIGPHEFGVRLAHGGWITRSTCKAINATLRDWGINHIKVNIKSGAMWVSRGIQKQVIDTSVVVPL